MFLALRKKKARDFLVKEIDKLEMKEIDFPSDINLIKAWCENDNKKLSGISGIFKS